MRGVCVWFRHLSGAHLPMEVQPPPSQPRRPPHALGDGVGDEAAALLVAAQLGGRHRAVAVEVHGAQHGVRRVVGLDVGVARFAQHRQMDRP